MKQVQVFRWEMASGTVPGKRIKTKYHLTEADAKAEDPMAQPLPGTGEWRTILETDEERALVQHRPDMQGPVKG
jgi:hypothetical protein